jgi:transcriptional regulator with PAS, ATPase and Fis domain
MPKHPITTMGALRIARPDEWRQKVEKALEEADGAVDKAAELLQVSTRTLTRWLAELPNVDRRGPGRPWD